MKMTNTRIAETQYWSFVRLLQHSALKYSINNHSIGKRMAAITLNHSVPTKSKEKRPTRKCTNSCALRYIKPMKIKYQAKKIYVKSLMAPRTECMDCWTFALAQRVPMTDGGMPTHAMHDNRPWKHTAITAVLDLSSFRIYQQITQNQCAKALYWRQAPTTLQDNRTRYARLVFCLLPLPRLNAAMARVSYSEAPLWQGRLPPWQMFLVAFQRGALKYTKIMERNDHE